MVPDNRFFPAPNDFDRTVNPSLVQSPGRQSQDDLD